MSGEHRQGAAPADADGTGRLKVVLGAQDGATETAFAHAMDLETFAALVRSGAIVRHIGRYRDVVGVAPSAFAVPRPFAVGVCLRLMARRSAAIVGGDGTRHDITWSACMSACARMLQDRRAAPRMLAAVESRLAELERLPPPTAPRLTKPDRTLCLRTDLWLGVKAGGAVAHTAGIVNALAAHGCSPVLAAFEANPIVDPHITQHELPLPERYWDLPEAPAISANIAVAPALDHLVDAVRPTLVYHRLAAFSFAGALLARRCGLPLIVEYNGSEVWIARNWGRPLRNEALAQRMEDAVLRAADRIVVVSAPLRDELIGRGLPAERIRTVMNGVDTARLHPAIDGAGARARYGIAGHETVIGFIGSFGPWHGVPVLVDAFARLVARPDGAGVRLLLIGDGAGRAEIEARCARLGLAQRVILSGLVAQADAPSVMAAADILVAPQVSNADGSPFFGSPTKLFEYMSLGRCIVASRLEQMAEVLTDGETALLVEPGDPDALSRALGRAVIDPLLRRRLGVAARSAAERMHDWTSRLNAIFD